MDFDLVKLGWFGTARQFAFPDTSERFLAAVAQKAAELGIDVPGLTDQAGGNAGLCWMVEAGTPEKWLAADKLGAYIEGLHDALTGSYGNPPVEVGRKDLRQVLDAVGRGMFVNDDVSAAAGRLRQVLDGQPVSAP